MIPVIQIRFDIATARKNANRYIKQYNAGIEASKDRIRNGVLATLMRVLDAYVKQNNFIGNLTGSPVPCRLNNCILASLLQVNRRTIINHLSKLEKAGLITKKFRGSNADYEVTVKSELVVGRQCENDAATDDENTGMRKKMPHNNLVQIEISNILPELCINPVTNKEISGQPPASAADNTVPATLSCNPHKAMFGGVDSTILSTSDEKKLGGAAAGRGKKPIPSWQKAMVADFYSLFIAELYPFRTYTGEVKRDILNKMYFHVFGAFKDASFTREQWETYQQELFERVRMIKAWLNRPLEGKKAQQFADGKFLVNPLTFLDKNCPYGFVQTEHWLQMKYQRQALIKAELELDKACKEMLQDTNKLRVYRKWETRFKNKKLPEATRLFYHAMASIQRQLSLVKNYPATKATTNANKHHQAI